jgi:hypothetical protein
LLLLIASISFSGIPHKPKPPIKIFAPFGMSLIASAGLLNISTNFVSILLL